MKQTMCAGAIACAIAMVTACGDDEALGPGTGGSSGTGASGGSGGAGGSSGSGGTDAGSGGSGGDAGPLPGRLLVAGTDFASKTEVATIDLATNTLTGSVTVDDGDAVPAQSNGQGFVLERTNAKLRQLDSSGKIAKTIDVGKTALGLTGAGSTNPVGVAVTSSKTLVFLHDVNRVAVVDLTAGTVTKTIDLSGYMASSDADLSVDTSAPILRAGRAYFLLGRIDRTTVAAPNYQLACPPVPALLMAIDVATESVVDLNGSAPGEGVELALVNPVDAGLEIAQDRLLVLSAGCYAATDGGATRVKHGVERVDLVTGSVSTLYAAPNQDFLSRLLVRSTSAALVNTFDPNYAEHWFSWSLSQSALGSELTGVPGAPTLDGEGHLLGVDVTTTDAGASVTVVRYDIGTQTKTNVVSSPWTGSFSAAAGTALVR